KITLFGEDHPALQVVAVASQAALFFRRGAAQLVHQVFEKFILGFAQRNDAAGLGVILYREKEGTTIARAQDAGQGRHAAVGAGQRAGLGDDAACELSFGESGAHRAGIDPSQPHHRVGFEAILIEPVDHRAQHHHGVARGHPVHVQPRPRGDLDLVRRKPRLFDQEVLHVLRAADVADQHVGHRIYAVRVLILSYAQQRVGFDRDQKAAARLAVEIFIFDRIAERYAAVAFEDARRNVGLRIVVAVEVAYYDQTSVDAPHAELAQRLSGALRVSDRER